MERLTKEFTSCEYCEDVECTGYKNSCIHRKVYEKLRHYEDLEEQGRLIELPCKTGDTVWLIPFVGGNPLGTIEEDQVTMVGITSKSTHVKTRRFSSYNTTYIIGKRAFLTKEEAEAKLKELKGE